MSNRAEGFLASLATRQPSTPEQEAERERLGRLFASDQLMSDMVIEDRGAY